MQTPRLRILLLPVLIASLWACAQVQPDGPVREASELYLSSQPAKAINILTRYLERPDLPIERRVDALKLLGDIRYSLQEFKVSAEIYSRARALQPGNQELLRHHWKARLAAAPVKETRAGVRREIEALLADSPGPDQLMSAYVGYQYLWDKAGQRAALLHLIKHSPAAAHQDELPYLLMEEIIQEQSGEKRIVLANYFLRFFSDHVTAPVIINNVTMQISKRQQLSRLLENTGKLGATNPYLKYRVAHFNLHGDQQAAGKTSLAELVEAADTGSLVACTDAETGKTCRYYANKLVANVYSEYAALMLSDKQLPVAMRYAKRATDTNPGSAAAWRLLAKLYLQTDNHKEARAALVNAMNLAPRADDISRQLFAHEKSFNPDPALAQNYGSPYFEDVTRLSGLHNLSARRAAWGDVNNDGYDDLLLSGPRLLLNRAGKHFDDVTPTAGFDAKRRSTGALFIDFDNDGRLDVLATGKHTTLYRNLGNNRFRPVERFNRGTAIRTAAASWGDFNNDGYADLYLANYERPGPHRAICFPDQLFINQQGKTFVDQSKLLRTPVPYPLCGRGVSWTDLDNDGRQEIIVSNYRLQPNSLLKQTGESALVDRSASSGYQEKPGGHSIASVSADFDNDGLPDLFQSNLAHPRYFHFSDTSRLLRNLGKLKLEHKPDSGITFNETDADVSAADFDNDGDLDLYITSVYPGRFSRLLLNDGKARFRNVSWLSNAQVENGWGVATADYDNDGDVDLLVASEDGIHLLRNRGNRNASLEVVFDNKKCQRNGIAARLWLRAGDRTWYREIQAGKGTGTQDSPGIVFGLGGYTGQLALHARDSCGNEYNWTGPHSQRKIIIS